MSSNNRDEGLGKYFAIQLVVAAVLFVPIVFFDVRGGLPVGAAIVFYVIETIILTFVMFLPRTGMRIIRSKLAKWLLVGVISIPLGFLWSMFGYRYNFATPGMYFAFKLLPPPPDDAARWAALGGVFFLGIAIDSLCCFALIWIVHTLFRRRPVGA